MLKLLIIAGWIFVAIDAFIAGAAILARDMGTDAAGRGLALGLGLVALVPLLLGGTALYFGGRAQSRLGVIASFVLLALPFLIFFGVEVEGWFHDIRVSFTNLGVSRFPERPQRALADAIDRADFQAMREMLATHPNLNGRNKAGYDLLGHAVRLVQSGDREDCQRRLEAVRLLLDAGMDPNAQLDGMGQFDVFVIGQRIRRSGGGPGFPAFYRSRGQSERNGQGRSAHLRRVALRDLPAVLVGSRRQHGSSKCGWRNAAVVLPFQWPMGWGTGAAAARGGYRRSQFAGHDRR
jgi:hypothetical protein